MFTVLIRLDCFVVDKLFQPIANAIEPWASCYRLASFFLSGGVFFLWVVVVVDAFTLGHDVSGMTIILAQIFGSGFATFVWMEAVKRADRLDRTHSEMMVPPDRYASFLPRWLFVLLSVIPASWPCRISIVCFVIGLFFMACYRRPPRVQRAPAALAVAQA